MSLGEKLRVISPEEAAAAAIRDAVVSLRRVSFGYDDSDILQNVTLAIPRGDFACVIGPNGSGKTTLIKLVLGLLEPRSGEVRVFGNSPREARARIGYMPQHAQLDPQFPVCVHEVVLMGRLGRGHGVGSYRAVDRDAARAALSEVGLSGLEKRPFAALSGGQRRRVLIARALACEPELLLLDEPTSNLDIQVEEQLYALLHELNRRLTIVLVSHDLGFVSQHVKTTVCVNRTVHTHPTGEVTGDVIRELFGRQVRLVEHELRPREPS